MTASARHQPEHTTIRALLTRERWVEIGRIVLVGLITLLYWQEWLPSLHDWLPLGVLLCADAAGLYPLVKTGLSDLVHDRKIGTEIFVTIATIIALLGGEYVAASVLMNIILIAEFIADLNTDRARASIKELIGSVIPTSQRPTRASQCGQPAPVRQTSDKPTRHVRPSQALCEIRSIPIKTIKSAREAPRADRQIRPRSGV